MIATTEDFESLNFAEAEIGTFVLVGSKLIIDANRIHVLEGAKDKYFRSDIGGFVGPLNIEISGVVGATTDYEKSRFLNLDRATCVGGIVHETNQYFEIWFEYMSAIVSIYEPKDLAGGLNGVYRGVELRNY